MATWGRDLIADRTHPGLRQGGGHGRPLRRLTVRDEPAQGADLVTPRSAALRVGRRLTPEVVQERLTELFCSLSVPEHIRSDTGPAFTTLRIRRWPSEVGTRALFIDPGSPGENGTIERFDGRLRGALQNREISYTRQQAEVLIERGRQQCSQSRPHSSLGCRSPALEGYRARLLGYPLAASAAFAVTYTLPQRLGAARSRRSSPFALSTVEPPFSSLVLS